MVTSERKETQKETAFTEGILEGDGEEKKRKETQVREVLTDRNEGDSDRRSHGCAVCIHHASVDAQRAP